MSVTDLLPTLQKLSRADKFRLMQFLVAELAQEETDGLQPSQTYPVWSPYDAFEAAEFRANSMALSRHKGVMTSS